MSIKRKTAGTASVEAVILLPFFILIFVAINYMGRFYEYKQKTLLTARFCAWEYANSGCDLAKISKRCKGIVKNTHGLKKSDGFIDQMRGGVLNDLSGIPIIGKAVEGLFGSALLANAKRQIKSQRMLRIGSVTVFGTNYLMCNEKQRNMLELIEDMFCHTVKKGFGCQ